MKEALERHTRGHRGSARSVNYTSADIQIIGQTTACSDFDHRRAVQKYHQSQSQNTFKLTKTEQFACLHRVVSSGSQWVKYDIEKYTVCAVE